jgi:hypothetical protein
VAEAESGSGLARRLRRPAAWQTGSRPRLRTMVACRPGSLGAGSPSAPADHMDSDGFSPIPTVCRSTALHTRTSLSNLCPQARCSSTTSPSTLLPRQESRDRRHMTHHAFASAGPDQTPMLRLHSLTDLLEAIPYLLGFHPTESLVVVMLHGARARVGTTMRYDLPTVGGSALACDVAAYASLHRADAAVLVVYAKRPHIADGLPEWTVVAQIREELARANVKVADSLCVSGGRWWSYLCVDPQCCPADGRPLPSPGAPPSRVAAAAASSGLVALPDRAALGTMLEPVAGSGRVSMERALAKAEEAFVETVATAGGTEAWRAAMRGRIHRIADRVLGADARAVSTLLTDEESAEILVALCDVPIRDACWLRAERGRSGDHLTLWNHLLRRALPPYDAAPLFLLGWVAWRRGDGALARIAAERALLSDVDYRAARLLLDILNSGVDPRGLPSLTGGRGRKRRAKGGRRC